MLFPFPFISLCAFSSCFMENQTEMQRDRIWIMYFIKYEVISFCLCNLIFYNIDKNDNWVTGQTYGFWLLWPSLLVILFSCSCYTLASLSFNIFVVFVITYHVRILFFFVLSLSDLDRADGFCIQVRRVMCARHVNRMRREWFEHRTVGGMCKCACVCLCVLTCMWMCFKRLCSRSVSMELYFYSYKSLLNWNKLEQIYLWDKMLAFCLFFSFLFSVMFSEKWIELRKKQENYG